MAKHSDRGTSEDGDQPIKKANPHVPSGKGGLIIICCIPAAIIVGSVLAWTTDHSAADKMAETRAWAVAKPNSLDDQQWAKRRHLCDELNYGPGECSKSPFSKLQKKIAERDRAKVAADKKADADKTRMAYDEMCDEDVGFTARNAARQAVSAALKAPATAEFDSAPAISHKGCVWTVAGVVDAQNGYGALIRSRYRARVLRLASDVWATVAVSVK